MTTLNTTISLHGNYNQVSPSSNPLEGVVCSESLAIAAIKASSETGIFGALIMVQRLMNKVDLK